MNLVTADLLKAMSLRLPDTAWRADPARQQVFIPTPDGDWVFQTPPGRRMESYLSPNVKQRRHLRCYATALAFEDLVLLAQLTAVCAAAGAKDLNSLTNLNAYLKQGVAI